MQPKSLLSVAECNGIAAMNVVAVSAEGLQPAQQLLPQGPAKPLCLLGNSPADEFEGALHHGRVTMLDKKVAKPSEDCLCPCLHHARAMQDYYPTWLAASAVTTVVLLVLSSVVLASTVSCPLQVMDLSSKQQQHKQQLP